MEMRNHLSAIEFWDYVADRMHPVDIMQENSNLTGRQTWKRHNSV
jgi:hypothetical protein